MHSLLAFFVTSEYPSAMLKLYDSLFFVWLIPYASFAHKKYVFDVTMQYKSPDCVESPTTLINGRFPGPMINVTVGELLEVEVKNHLASDSITIHFHGQLQKGSVWHDGIGMISSCPIAPKTSFTYRFHVNNEPGTYVYHGHIGGIRSAGLYGMLIIHPMGSKKLQPYDEERSLLLSDWYHGSHLEIALGLLEENFRWAGNPESVLINGRGYYNCTKNAVPMDSNYPYFKPKKTKYCTISQCPGLEIIEVPKDKIIRLRLGSVTELSFLNVAIEGHNLTVIEADGKPIVPIEVQSLDINSGQRYSVLINTSQPIASYWISIMTRHRSDVVTGQAILRYSGNTSLTPSSGYETVLARQPKWDDSAFTLAQQVSMKGVADAPANDKVTRRIVLLGTQERFLWKHKETAHNHSIRRPEQYCNATDRHMRWALNGVTYQWENTPVAHMAYFQIRQDTLTENRGYFKISEGDVIDVIIQNYPACNEVCEQHPWHLHGHKFWVVGTGRGLWNGSASQLAQLNTKNAVRRDTTTVIPDAEKPFGGQAKQGGCGWTAIRFIADNPGVWPFHCHITWHFVMGMQVIFLEATGRMPKPGDDIPICGEVTPGLWMKRRNVAKDMSTCDELSLWIALLVGWCLSFGLIIVLVFYCRKDMKTRKSKNQYSLESYKR